MRVRWVALVGLLAACAGAERTSTAPRSSNVVRAPRLWDDVELRDWATPVAGLGVPPSYPTPAEYYAAPVDDLRTYPVYHPSREPPGYRESLRRRGAQRIIEPEKLHTEADWIEAGRRVFDELDEPEVRTSDPRVIAHFNDAATVDKYRKASFDVMTPDGVMVDYRWVVGRDGSLEMSIRSCAGCHTRAMPDGTLLPGAPGNFDFAFSPASDILLNGSAVLRRDEPEGFYSEFGVPWRTDDLHAAFRKKSKEEVRAFWEQDMGDPTGTMFARFNGSPFYPTRMADLRGIKHRRYLDATGTHKNRGPADVARYGILVAYADTGVFGPHHMRPPTLSRVRVRPSDEAMYALALYLYSLEPPPSPHPMDERARRGQEIFERNLCPQCHTPPDYTNNKLVPVEGFEPPHDPQAAGLDVSPMRVGTDPGMALRTRKGTGYYKVPSLRGLWYRGLFEHNGSVATLEDWFDPARLRDDYVPTGFRGPGVKTRAVPGHRFGLDLSPDDKKALIAFLKTL